VHEPGSLLASGRDADIFEYGPTTVLRRSRKGRSLANEAHVMTYARAAGYPVPAVEEISDDGTDLVMERVTGPSMLSVLGRRPWSLDGNGAILADLHLRLHDIAAPDGVGAGPGQPGDRLLHLDLHPLNVLLSPRGPVVIDWTNACRGVGATDVALTWVLMMSAAIPAGRLAAAVLGRARSLFVRRFVGHFDREAVAAELASVVAWKVHDPHMSAAEQAAMWRLAASEGAAAQP